MASLLPWGGSTWAGCRVPTKQLSSVGTRCPAQVDPPHACGKLEHLVLLPLPAELLGEHLGENVLSMGEHLGFATCKESCLGLILGCSLVWSLQGLQEWMGLQKMVESPRGAVLGACHDPYSRRGAE